MEPAEPSDVRYAAFISLERAGPTPEAIALVRQLSDDEMLGLSAESILLRWQTR
jgi:hypothetical protein